MVMADDVVSEMGKLGVRGMQIRAKNMELSGATPPVISPSLAAFELHC
jgi:hypothetical protein